MDVLLGPDAEQTKNIRKVLDEDQDRFAHNRKLLQQWIACQPHLPQNYDERLLSFFLRGCKHNLERTKKKIEAYFIARSSCPEFFANRNPTKQEIDAVMQTVNLFPLPKLTPEGYRINVLNLRSTDPSDFDMKSCTRLIFMIADIRLLRETEVAGDIFIDDCRGVTAEHFVKFITPSFVKAMTLGRTAYPHRLHSVHIVNVSTIGEKLLRFAKTLVHEKIRDRFLIHKTSETLLNYFPRDVLPPEYHGTGEDMDTLKSKWSKCILDHAEWFRQQENVKATGTVHNNLLHAWAWEDTLGIQGSFRQLAID